MDRPVVRTTRLSRAQILGLIIVSLVLLLVVAAIPAIRRFSRADQSIDATTIRTAVVTRGDLQRDAWVQGRVVASLHPALFSAAQGVVSLRVKAGTPIHRGDVLAIVESSELRSSLAQAEAQLASLRADLERQKIVAHQSGLRGSRQVELLVVRADAAKRALERADRAFKEGIGNRAELEAAQDASRIATIEMEQAQKDLTLDADTLSFDVRNREQQVLRQESVTAELRKKADDLTIRAPFDGIVAQVAVQDRDAVAANQSIVSVVNLSSFEIEISIPEEYADQTKIGMPVTIHTGDSDVAGRVTAIAPEVANGQVIGTVQFTGEPPVGLKQSERMTVRLLFDSRTNVLKVARGSFAEGAGGHTAYVVTGNVAQRRPIQLGATSTTEVEVVGGLHEGDRVITSDVSAFNRAETILLR